MGGGGEWTCPGSFKKFELRLLYLSTQERHRISPIPDYVHKLLLEIKYGLDGAGTQLVIQGKAIKALTSIGHPVQLARGACSVCTPRDAGHGKVLFFS